MSKKPNSKKAVKRDEPMTTAMKFFLVGCVAELFLLVVNRYYINGSALQLIAWYDHYLKYCMIAGAVVLAAGAGLSYLWKADRKKRDWGWSVAILGVFVTLASALIQWNMNLTSVLSVIVPVVMLLGILWTLYDRECAMSLTILGVSLIALWLSRRVGGHLSFGVYAKVAVVVYLLALAAVAFLLKQGKLPKLLPAKADPLPVYLACGLSVVALAAALVSTVIAYYAMWALAIVVFGLAVYYTVKQL